MFKKSCYDKGRRRLFKNKLSLIIFYVITNKFKTISINPKSLKTTIQKLQNECKGNEIKTVIPNSFVILKTKYCVIGCLKVLILGRQKDIFNPLQERINLLFYSRTF
ncbi:MAG: hypothetical protein COB88_08410 [Flavobacteriales bacterium]|nr:MAG: hypothetical protein COB88_08410 [Flavobacteriales bacterium]